MNQFNSQAGLENISDFTRNLSLQEGVSPIGRQDRISKVDSYGMGLDHFLPEFDPKSLVAENHPYRSA